LSTPADGGSFARQLEREHRASARSVSTRDHLRRVWCDRGAQSSLRRSRAESVRSQPNETFGGSGRTAADQAPRPYHYRRAGRQPLTLLQLQRGGRALKIHTSAVIDAGAKLGADVEIGPYAVIGPKVVIGDRTVLQSHAVIDGTVQIGTDNVIGYGAIIGAAPQDLSFK